MMRDALSPRATQEAVLRRILATNAETDFGREHGFASMATVSDYRQAVPVLTYEDLREAIERQELTGERCLTQEQPVYYHRTSGTVGAPKNIPVTASGLAQMKRDQRLSAYVWARDSGVLESKVFAVSGAAVEGHMAGGTPLGSASGLLYRNQSRFVQSRYVLPAEVSDVEDYDARYLAMAAYGLAEPGVTGAATANPSTFLRLLAVVHDNADAVLGAIASGSLPGAASGLSLTPRPERARELERRLRASRPAHVRGHLAGPAGRCHMDGWQLRHRARQPVAAAAGRRADHRMGVLVQRVPGDAERRRGAERVPADVPQHVLRVRGARRVGGGRGQISSASTSWRTGGSTTCWSRQGDGLYRYDINDIVRVNGWVGATHRRSRSCRRARALRTSRARR